MPTWNYAEVLPYSIGSGLWQGYTDFELLVVGDGCTDDSEKVVTAIDDPRVRWINLPSNTGNASGPINEGTRQARGELIAYLTHDDMWLPHHLGALVEAIDRGADFAYSISALLRPDGHHSVSPLQALAPGQAPPPANVVHTKALADRIGPWRLPGELSTEQDGDAFGRMQAAGCKMRFVPHISLLKWEAARRQDVYKDRPTHEQHEWRQRVLDGRILDLIDLQESRVARIRDQAVADQGAAKALYGLGRALLRPARQWLRKHQHGRVPNDGDGHVYAGDYDWSGLSDEERQRRYRELYARRRAFKGLPPVDFDEDGAIEGEPRG